MITQQQLDKLDEDLEALDLVLDNLDVSQTSDNELHKQRKCKKHVKIRKKQELWLEIQKITTKPAKYTGTNTMFSTKNGSSFFLLDILYHKVVTNNKRLERFRYFSNTVKVNDKYVISKFVWGIMKFLNLHKMESKNKIFSCIKCHMIITQQSLLKRMSEDSKNNKKTRTYFRFSVGSQTFYFGWYKSCNTSQCIAPITSMNKVYKHCDKHSKEIQRGLTPVPKVDSNRKENGHSHAGELRTITSQRLGLSYKKKLTWSWRNEAYYIAFSDLEFFDKRSKHQIARFERMIKNITKQREKAFLKGEERTVVRKCRHGLPKIPQLF